VQGPFAWPASIHQPARPRNKPLPRDERDEPHPTLPVWARTGRRAGEAAISVMEAGLARPALAGELLRELYLQMMR